jgi:hypothetical protein
MEIEAAVVHTELPSSTIPTPSVAIVEREKRAPNDGEEKAATVKEKDSLNTPEPKSSFRKKWLSKLKRLFKKQQWKKNQK